VVARVVALLRPEADDRGVTIQVDRAPVPPLSIDAEQMTQVFVNVVLNAIQASPPGGRVVVRSTDEDGLAAIEVRDQGPGIREEDVHRVFEPFFSTKQRGTGLGLATSQRIVQAHEGRIEIQQPGCGTVVRVLLPLALMTDPRAQTRPNLAGPAAPGRSHGADHRTSASP
jgi:signal transduction histidine kinase